MKRLVLAAACSCAAFLVVTPAVAAAASSLVAPSAPTIASRYPDPLAPPGTPTPRYTDKTSPYIGGTPTATPTSPAASSSATPTDGSTPMTDEQLRQWVKDHTFVAPDVVATGLVGTTPGPNVWWTWNGVVTCNTMPVDGVCTDKAPATRPTHRPAPRKAVRTPSHRTLGAKTGVTRVPTAVRATR